MLHPSTSPPKRKNKRKTEECQEKNSDVLLHVAPALLHFIYLFIKWSSINLMHLAWKQKCFSLFEFLGCQRGYRNSLGNRWSKSISSKTSKQTKTGVNEDSHVPVETMTPKSTVHMVVCFLQLCIVKGQIICERQIIAEWRVEPKHVLIEWTLRKNICTDFYSECWNVNKNATREDKNLSVPQICPVQLQLGDTLFISSEPSFQSYGMNLVNVSKEEFINCPKIGFLQEQQIFVCQRRGLHQVDSTWLGVGTHYFAELHKRGPYLCNMGLRLNVTVKQQFCQETPNAPLCSKHGRCLSRVWEKQYSCHCFSQYSGKFCQKFNVCSTKPCHNNASCTEKLEGIRNSYECTCPPEFSGIFFHLWISVIVH